MPAPDLPRDLNEFLVGHEQELIAFRRDLHAHPETAHAERRTTARVAQRLTAAGLRPRLMSSGTGLWADVGTGDGPMVALRADLDALPIADEKNVPYRSTVPNACHACGHDVHTTVLLGAGLYLAERARRGLLPGRVRLLFQPAEEVVEGALAAMGEGAITGVDKIFALHCDPRFEVGQLGLRVGPITGACDKIRVQVSGPGGHTARPHLTADLVYALGKIVTELPAALSRRVDPRSSLSLVWGRITAGLAPNAIPEEGFAAGTVRCLDEEAWHQAPDMLKGLVGSVASAYGVIAELDYVRGVPPAVNDEDCVRLFGEAAELALGPEAAAQAQQSLGGEDVAWYLESIPGALARLGIRGPQTPTDLDIHQANFDIDERAIGVGVKVMATTALLALLDGSASEKAVASTRGMA
ncbi:MAG TPA: amidohydrolase [Actinobacteria bacterium]|nr:amidohydrolase [Actinomycetota bacterium]